ncbi:hypothetical protein [Chromobacterium violaceum]|uniref:hypothetical protein n=1 Tax=Chromobacterium violaceum TaxID=536 RepID=UPI00194F7387|nr:hypothetical protein [Chromobacterium violaceum]QRO33976.1 hypothetical protein I6K04_04325 [Chromobacterium violaceum]QRQ16221.1 hypothetical protein I6K03_18405 [Chromobacterium violaceum]
MQIDVMPFISPLIRVGALLLMALMVGMFAAAYVNHRMLLMDYPNQQRRKWRTLAFEASTVAIVALGSLVLFLPA